MRAPNETISTLSTREVKVLDHGFIRVVDWMGNDAAIVQAARVSYGAGTKTAREDEGLIRYLMRHQHTTPFEMCEIKFHVKLPIFVARQWIRHRTANVNEYSGRYSVMESEFFVPEVEKLAVQSASNRQGREEGGYDPGEGNLILTMLREHGEMAFDAYSTLLQNHDLSRELARTLLPLSTYTEWYWKIDLKNLFHFLNLRTDSHAQWEIRAYAIEMEKIVAEWVPMAYQAWVDWERDVVKIPAYLFSILRAVKCNPDTLQAYIDLQQETPEELSKGDQTLLFDLLEADPKGEGSST